MKATLIHNPGAGVNPVATAGQIEALMKHAGYKVRYQSTNEKGWSRALKKPADLVVVAAGDGTVGRVARRMVGKGIPIAVLPMGTANNISKTLGIVDLQLTELIAGWKDARHVEFDAGVAAGPWGERYFVEGVGAGLMTTSIPEVENSRTMNQLKDAAVKVTYAQQLFREHLMDSPIVEVNATLDGADISGRYVLFEVLNMKYVGPNLRLAPDVVPNDGQFQVILLTAKHRKKLHDHIKHWQEGKPMPLNLGAKQGEQLEIQWTGFPLHIDDKLWPRAKDPQSVQAAVPVRLTVAPKSLEFLVPREVHDMQKLATESGRQET